MINNLGDITTRIIKGKQYCLIGVGSGKWKYFLIQKDKKPKEVKIKW